MLNLDTSKLEKSSCEIIEAFDQMSWKWDDRFETALAEFSVKDKEFVEKHITVYMSAIWDVGNCGSAPESVKSLIGCFGGLNPGQLLFTSDPEGHELILCAAWWPWGNGTTISIRLGAFGNCLSDGENEELTKLFRQWLNI